MSKSKDELTSDCKGLENGEFINHSPRPKSEKSVSSASERNKLEDMVTDNKDQSEFDSDEKMLNDDRDKCPSITDNTTDEGSTQADSEKVADHFPDHTSLSKNNDSDGEVDSAEPTTNCASEDDKLLSEISELVDQKQGEDDLKNADEVNYNDNDFESMETEEKTETDNEIPLEGGIDNGASGEFENKVGENEKNIDSYEMKDDLESNTSENQAPVQKPMKSAVQKLASLGLIPEEKPVVEDKETILKKLASRGGISIMPAGSALSTVSSPSSKTPTKPVSIKPSPSKSGILKPVSVLPTSVTPTKYKPGPKSTKKKIKIDPGKSLDIDKDFNSLINFLSAGTEVSSTSVSSSTPEEKNVSNETVSEKVNSPNPEIGLHDMNETSNQSTNDGQASAMDVDTNEEKSFPESESESHDGSKFENNSENDDRTPTINKNKNVIEEGSAEILLSANKNVFYNKVQEFNRDMSIAALTVFSEMHQQDPRTRNRGKKRKAGDLNETDSKSVDGVDDNIFEAGKKSENGITILEALSATGLRSIRYAREIPGVKEIIANDLSEDAVETIKKNVEHNGVEQLVTASMNDASLLMYLRQVGQEWYDAVDLDPYGCPARFLDAAVQAVRDGGLLLVTCTDMAILAGNSPETCYVKYGAVSLRMPACHEMALRIALQCIESHANRYGRYIVPLLSFSADFYIRLIVQVYTSPVTCKRTTSKLSMVYQCVGCGTHSLHPLGNTSQVGHNAQPKFSLTHGPPVNTSCFHCQHKHNIGGPIWTAPLYSPRFVESMLRVVENGRFGTAKRMQGMLEVIREELQDVPLYYTIAGLCTKLHCQAIPLIDIRSAILNAGYRVSSSHAAPTAIKTTAPSKIIWDIMRCWVHMNPVSQKRLIKGSVPAAIIQEPPNLIANFDIHPRARPSSAVRKLVRYQQNPEKNWGPGTRARCNNAEDSSEEKRRLNQNKNKNKKHIDIIEVVTIDDEDEITEENKATETETAPPSDKE